MRSKSVEYWRSRLFTDLVYWRSCEEWHVAPESGTPSELARVLLRMRAQYGQPERGERDGLYGKVRIWRFNTPKRFYVSTSNRFRNYRN